MGIRELRQQKRLTQKRLAELSGISQSKLSYAERGLPLTEKEQSALAGVLLAERDREKKDG